MNLSQSQLPKSDNDWQFENQWVELITRYGRQIALGIAILIALCLFSYWTISKNQQADFSDYINAQKAMDLLREAKSEDLSSADGPLSQLKGIIQRHPELHAKYDGWIAQFLLERGNIKEAEAFALLTLNRVKVDHLPLYRDFSINSLLIENQNYEEALQKSLALKELIADQIQTIKNELITDLDQDLFASNLLRIAFLQQQLGNQAGEKNAWNDLQQYLSRYPLTAEKLSPLFQAGNISLEKYIEMRLRTRSKSSIG